MERRFDSGRMLIYGEPHQRLQFSLARARGGYFKSGQIGVNTREPVRHLRRRHRNEHRGRDECPHNTYNTRSRSDSGRREEDRGRCQLSASREGARLGCRTAEQSAVHGAQERERSAPSPMRTATTRRCAQPRGLTSRASNPTRLIRYPSPSPHKRNHLGSNTRGNAERSNFPFPEAVIQRPRRMPSQHV